MDSLLSRLAEQDWSRHWVGWKRAPATTLPERFEQLLRNPNTELRAEFSKDLQLSSRAWALLVPTLFDALLVPELPPATRRFLARSIGALAWPSRWLSNRPSLPDDAELDRKAAFVRQAQVPEALLNGAPDAEEQHGIDWGGSGVEPHHHDASEIPEGLPLVDRVRDLLRFGITLGLEYPAQQETRRVMGAQLAAREWLTDADDGVTEELIVAHTAFPQLAPRLWKVVEARLRLAPQALLALAFQGADPVQNATQVLWDQLDPRDDAATFFIAVAEVFSARAPVSRNSRARLARRDSPTFAQTPCVFGNTLGFLRERANERLSAKK
jgi:hypothetical protein